MLEKPTLKNIILEVMEIESGKKLATCDASSVDGGLTNDPDDPGGCTNWGWTQASLIDHGITTHPSKLTFKEAFDAYEKFYMDRSGASSILNVHPYLSRILFNFAVHAGYVQAVKNLQLILNIHNNLGTLYPDIKEDGLFGRGTMAALSSFLAKRGAEGKDIIVMEYLIRMGAHYQDIVRKRERSEKYMMGWSRRIMGEIAYYVKYKLEDNKDPKK